MDINGKKGTGTLSVEKADNYEFEIKLSAKPNYVQITSCHQELIFENTDKKFEFWYYPTADIESIDLPCFVEITSLDESGANEFGLVNFKIESEKLDAHLFCNGQERYVNGSEICQAREGLIQQVIFKEDVTVLFPDDCATIAPETGKKFMFKMSPASCIYLFYTNDKRLFRLVTYGYNEIAT